jgi:hypothetical protein
MNKDVKEAIFKAVVWRMGNSHNTQALVNDIEKVIDQGAMKPPTTPDSIEAWYAFINKHALAMLGPHDLAQRLAYLLAGYRIFEVSVDSQGMTASQICQAFDAGAVRAGTVFYMKLIEDTEHNTEGAGHACTECGINHDPHKPVLKAGSRTLE